MPTARAHRPPARLLEVEPRVVISLDALTNWCSTFGVSSTGTNQSTPLAQTASTEVAPMIASIWPETLAGRVARLIAGHPDLGRRLALASERTLHLLAIWLHHAVAAGMDDDAMAAAILGTDARRLLAEALSDPSPDLPRALGRVGAKVRDAAFYRDLNAVLSGPAANALPSEGQITRAHLRTAQAIVAFGRPLTHIAAPLAGSDRLIEAAGAAVRYLRALGLAKAIEETPPRSGWKAFARRMMDDLDAACSPLAALPAPSGWRVIETVGDLRAVGRALRLCVADLGFGAPDYLNSFISGRAAFLTSEQHKALALVARFEDEWVVTELSLRAHGTPSSQVRRDLEEGLRAGGLRVASLEPVSAIMMVLSQARCRGLGLSVAEDDDPAAA